MVNGKAGGKLSFLNQRSELDMVTHRKMDVMRHTLFGIHKNSVGGVLVIITQRVLQPEMLLVFAE